MNSHANVITTNEQSARVLNAVQTIKPPQENCDVFGLYKYIYFEFELTVNVTGHLIISFVWSTDTKEYDKYIEKPVVK